MLNYGTARRSHVYPSHSVCVRCARCCVFNDNFVPFWFHCCFNSSLCCFSFVSVCAAVRRFVAVRCICAVASPLSTAIDASSVSKKRPIDFDKCSRAEGGLVLAERCTVKHVFVMKHIDCALTLVNVIRCCIQNRREWRRIVSISICRWRNMHRLNEYADIHRFCCWWHSDRMSNWFVESDTCVFVYKAENKSFVCFLHFVVLVRRKTIEHFPTDKPKMDYNSASKHASSNSLDSDSKSSSLNSKHGVDTMVSDCAHFHFTIPPS